MCPCPWGPFHKEKKPKRKTSQKSQTTDGNITPFFPFSFLQGWVKDEPGQTVYAEKVGKPESVETYNRVVVHSNRLVRVHRENTSQRQKLFVAKNILNIRPVPSRSISTFHQTPPSPP